MFKVPNKGTRMMSGEIFWVSDLKAFYYDIDNVFVCIGHHFYYLFVGKFLRFEKNAGIYRQLHIINLKKLL